ncbi:hypothetical protein GM418_00665 [Maribellus comscasis]|uniref:Uncharacterized protein n=1 Tax=Maribellus comscasis TaxID=2681766 RepID=A0A6I6JMD8_9BACT|nr:carbohydrate binding family 9 domain-containing protein [Maribellus comscasis]QGY42218.1 hypothetical protein GM418_00665 [Maribellus comscasis]
MHLTVFLLIKNKNPLIFLFFGLVGILFLPQDLLAQRVVDISQYPPEYFDSIRANVYDTTNVNYTIRAYRLSSEDKIVIDGNLDEPAWKIADRKTNFIEKDPYPLIPTSDETEFAILYDDENLYVGVWCWDAVPDKIVAYLAPRGTYGADNLQLFIDSYNDDRTGYKFVISPTGVQGDELRYDDVKRDRNWNGIWYSEGKVDDKGWYVEVKIPFFNMRYSSSEQQTWGFNIMRTMAREASRSQWKPHLPEWENNTRMSQLGQIVGIKNISSGRTFELRPYGTVSSTEALNVSPFKTLNLGGDIRFSPSPNLTADFTFNPDFAQVDADVFEINLTRFPTRFAELRPFFTERINVFNTPLELFYSRRIGAKGDILGGVKMTGKLNHGVEFGVLGNVTGKSVFKSALQNSEKATFGVMRVKKDILGSSNIGILAATKEEADNYNRIFGVDGSFVLSGNDFVDFQVATGQTEKQTEQNMAYNLIYTRTGDLMGLILTGERIEPEFEINRVGYIQKEAYRGWDNVTGTYKLSPRINKYNLRRITANATLEFDRDLFTSEYINNVLQNFPDFVPDVMFGSVTTNDEGNPVISDGSRTSNNYKVGGDLTINMINEMIIVADYKRFTATELTGQYSGNLLTLSYSTRPINKGASFAGVFGFTNDTYYNFNQKYVARQRKLTLEGEGRLTRNFLTTLIGDYTETFTTSDHKDGRYFKLSSNSTWMFTKDFYLRVHAQGILGTTFYQQKEIYNEYLLSCLMSWEYRPGSFLYLAYNEGRFDPSGNSGWRNMSLNNRTIILKISYFFSI